MFDVNKTGVLTEADLRTVFAPLEDGEPLWAQLHRHHHVL